MDYLLVIWGIFAIVPRSEIKQLNVNLKEKNITIPAGSVHWHPRLTIKIDGELTQIPTGIGSTIGKVIDVQLSGMRMSPTHTHETDGKIHLENNNPSSKPETLTLGYFFYVWDKQFNSTCIFNLYCTNKGDLEMYVNGQKNSEFEDYVMRDKDNVFIVYNSF